MDQPTFAELEYESKKRKTRREIFLERMDGLIPWERLEERIRPFYPKAGRGRRPYELSAMLRIHCVQLFYNLSDPGMEDMLYEVESVRRFVGLRLSGPLPDETTILNFRHLLEEHELGQGLFEEINRHLESQGLRLREGTIVDASQRYERGSVLVTTNLPFDEWTEVFGSERLTGALLDRLTHRVHILEMNGESYRLKQSRQAVTTRSAGDSPDA